MAYNRKYNSKKPAYTHDDFKKAVAEKFITLLDPENETDPMKWVKEWTGMSAPVSVSTGKEYRGVNAIMLGITQIEKGYSDPRWVTHSYLEKNFTKYEGVDEEGNPAKVGGFVKKSEKGTKIEYWFLKDNAQEINGQKNPDYGKTYTWPEAAKICASTGREMNEFIPKAKYFTVFNAEQCVGLPELEVNRNMDIEQADFVSSAAEGMGVDIVNDGNNQAFYNRKEDKVHLPLKESFNSEYAYNATALHELGHASGAEYRLNRTKGKAFGDKDYAFEELVAEMTSCMASTHLVSDDMGMDEYLKDHAENHMRYVKSWAESIKENPDCLYEAIKLAQIATDYLEVCAGLEDPQVFLNRNKEVSKDAVLNPTALDMKLVNDEYVIMKKGEQVASLGMFDVTFSDEFKAELLADPAMKDPESYGPYVKDAADKYCMVEDLTSNEINLLAPAVEAVLKDVVNDVLSDPEVQNAVETKAEELAVIEAQQNELTLEL